MDDKPLEDFDCESDLTERVEAARPAGGPLNVIRPGRKERERPLFPKDPREEKGRQIFGRPLEQVMKPNVGVVVFG